MAEVSPACCNASSIHATWSAENDTGFLSMVVAIICDGDGVVVEGAIPVERTVVVPPQKPPTACSSCCVAFNPREDSLPGEEHSNSGLSSMAARQRMNVMQREQSGCRCTGVRRHWSRAGGRGRRHPSAPPTRCHLETHHTSSSRNDQPPTSGLHT